MSQQTRLVYQFGPFTLDTREGLLLRDGEAIPLTLKAYEILHILVENGGHVVEKDFFLRKVWPNTYVEEANLAQNIFRLRKILDESDTGVHYIETVPKRGYRFIANVKVVEEGLAMAAGAASHSHLTSNGSNGDGAKTLIQSLAVMPLDNAGVNQDAQYLADGISESIINNLSQLNQLRVLAWSTMVQYKGKAVDVLKVGRELSLKYVLMGKLLTLGNKVVVRVELVDVENGWQVWGEQYMRDFSDFMAIQEDISWEVSERLRLKLTSEDKRRLAQRPSDDTEAVKLYLKGRFLWHKRSAGSLKKAIDYLQKAIETDPHFALAHVAMADCYNYLSVLNLLAPREAFPKAKTEVMKALELNGSLAEAQASLAFINMAYDWDWTGAQRGFKKAIAQSPNYVLARLWYAKYLSLMGRFAEALSEADIARSLDPLSLLTLKIRAHILYLAREYDRAIEQYQEAIEIGPDFAMAYKLISLAYAQKGMYEEAIDYCRKGFSLSGEDMEAKALLGCFYAAMGQREKALDVLDVLRDEAGGRYVSSGHISLVYLGLGEYDEAVNHLWEAYKERSEILMFSKVLPILDPVRSHERFQELLGRIGFTS
ncbi:MAG TPA: winged helix-turn-helix domain-containing protein [Pyrinomonadaceae bacterium]|nr:winged helix-turn-helix domain-containing protein [Pyrinomonadaceae bacterium]